MTRFQHLLLVALLAVGFAVLWRINPGLDLPSLPTLVAEGWGAPLRLLETLPAWAWWTAFGVAMSLRCGHRKRGWGTCAAARRGEPA